MNLRYCGASLLRPAGHRRLQGVLLAGLCAAALTPSSAATGADPLPWSDAFAVPADARPPLHRIEGRLRFAAVPGATSLAVLQDDFALASNPGLRVRDLPDFDVEFVQEGRHLLPVRRDPIRSEHPSWEWLLSPGDVWRDPEDPGWSRALIPFALAERNANCVHYGVLALRFRAGETSPDAHWQIASETCVYFRFNGAGRARIEYIRQPVAQATAARRAYRDEVRHRLPTRPFAALTTDYPRADAADFGNPQEVPPESMTAYGLVVNGVHYTGGCGTRAGPFPFCAVMPLPSYSLAKSLFAGLALMRLEALWPGSANTAIATWVPQCEPGQGWSAITLANAVDMATGRYELDGPEADEDAAIASPLFLAEDHATRIDYACRRYAQRVAPGTRFSYHTSDTYLAVTAMSALWRQKMGPGTDLYRDAMAGQLWRPLGLSPVTFETRRTRDDAGQPFGGWGLFLLRDDMARLGAWLTSTPGVIGAKQVLDRRLMTAALQRDPQDRGLREGESELRYRLGFHAIDVARYVGCRHAVWVPFLSGYGGITLALFPNGVVYYSVSDGGAHHWARAIRGADKIQPMCIE